MYILANVLIYHRFFDVLIQKMIFFSIYPNKSHMNSVLCRRSYPRFPFPSSYGFFYSQHVNGVIAAYETMSLSHKAINTWASYHLVPEVFIKDMEKVVGYLEEPPDTERIRKIASAKANTIINVALSILDRRPLTIEERLHAFVEWVSMTYQVDWMTELVPLLAEQGMDMSSEPFV